MDSVGELGMLSDLLESCSSCRFASSSSSSSGLVYGSTSSLGVSCLSISVDADDNVGEPSRSSRYSEGVSVDADDNEGDPARVVSGVVSRVYSFLADGFVELLLCLLFDRAGDFDDVTVFRGGRAGDGDAFVLLTSRFFRSSSICLHSLILTFSRSLYSKRSFFSVSWLFLI